MDPIQQLLNVPPAGTATITAEEISSLRSTRNPREWNAAVAAVESARGGHYPPDWYQVVIASGLHHEIAARWEI